MTATNFAAALAFTLSQEGGWSDRPDDDGGATMEGITLATYREALGQPDLTYADLHAMTDEQRDRIYLMNYWQPIRGNDLPSGLDLAAFDFAVNAGPETAAKWLQAALGVYCDGIIGSVTLAAAQAQDTATVIKALTVERLAFYSGLDKPQFMAGWTARANACKVAALAGLA